MIIPLELLQAERGGKKNNIRVYGFQQKKRGKCKEAAKTSL